MRTALQGNVRVGLLGLFRLDSQPFCSLIRASLISHVIAGEEDKGKAAPEFVRLMS
jgi:hypothetical protein